MPHDNFLKSIQEGSDWFQRRVPARHKLNQTQDRLQLLDPFDNAVCELENFSAPLAAPTKPMNAWVASVSWLNLTGSAISSFSSTWTVPDPPATPGSQTVYLFNSLKFDGDQFGILQPVLEWSRGDDNTPAWYISSWYVVSSWHRYIESGVEKWDFIDDFAVRSRRIPVSPGDSLTGIISLKKIWQNKLFGYRCEFEGFDATRIDVDNLPELTTCTETLEVYGIEKCTDYPASPSTKFTNILVETKAGYPYQNEFSWYVDTTKFDCGRHVEINNPSPAGGEVSIYYR